MKKFLWLVCASLFSYGLAAQSFEISPVQEHYKGLIGETIRAPLRFKNLTDRPVTIIVKKISGEIGSSQKHYFCPGNNCLDSGIENFQLKIDPGKTADLLQIALDAGLSEAQSILKYRAFNAANPEDAIEFELNFSVEEKARQQAIFTSRHITLYNVYPNPVSEHAFVDYKVFDDRVKAKIVIHNLLGTSLEEYLLPPLENKVKIPADGLSPGIYFYTLYLDDEGVITRKLIVKK